MTCGRPRVVSRSPPPCRSSPRIAADFELMAKARPLRVVHPDASAQGLVPSS